MASGRPSIPVSRALALTGHANASDLAAYRDGSAVSAEEFVSDVAHAAAALPDARHVLNLCADRYRFAVALGAAIARGQTTLLPPTTTPHLIRSMRAFAPDAYYIADDAAIQVALPRFELPRGSAPRIPWPGLDAIAAGQVVACVFTSGSTGEPQPNFKTWGRLVANVRSEAARLGITGAGHAILGTVPPQHMYGFESTVLLPLLAGAALTNTRPYYPADIDAAIEALPAARTLFTTPFHLRAWLGSQQPARLETLVSATAPLALELAHEAEARTGAALHEIYGCTEAGQLATRRPTQDARFRLYDGIELHECRGQAVASGGHVEQPTALQDVLEIVDDGRGFVLHGRFADMVNIAGKRSSLAYLNHQLLAIPGVVDGAFYMPEERERSGVTRLAAFAVAPALDERAILAALRERLDDAFLPRPLLRVEALPREASGKLSRAALAALAVAARTRRAENS
jgi:acyl-coenzyme A synthetase/AMP-(fatty) acid ligase